MRHDRFWQRELPLLQAALAVAAGYGSTGLLLQLDGFDMPTSWLRPLPLSSWVLPGIALLLGIALPLAAAAVAGWRHDRRAPTLSWLAVGLLMGWLMLQFAVMGLRAPVQVVTLGVTLVLLVMTARTAGLRR
jgi:hypothetical protein